MERDNDRFGMPQSAFDAANKSHGVNNPTIRCGMYVPTRHEVATLPIEELSSILIDWMWESPSQLIPGNDQIEEVKAILASRSDAETGQASGLIAECDTYLRVC